MSAGGIMAEVSQGDVAKFQKAMSDFERRTGKSVGDAVRFASYSLAQTLSGQTRKSKKLRKIVKNPDAKKARLSPLGVMRYHKGQAKFRPLSRTGEYGKIRYLDKHTSRVKEWDKATGAVKYVTFSDKTIGNEGGISMANDKRRKIGRSGLAKYAWKLASMGLMRGGSGKGAGALGGDVIRVAAREMRVRKQLTGNAPEVRFDNHLNYAGDAFIGPAGAAISTAMRAAAESMQYKIRSAIYGSKLAK